MLYQAEEVPVAQWRAPGHDTAGGRVEPRSCPCPLLPVQDDAAAAGHPLYAFPLSAPTTLFQNLLPSPPVVV